MLADHRTFGDLFYACCVEIHDITFMESVLRILSVATERLRQLGIFCEKTFEAFYYQALRAAIECLRISNGSSIVFSMNPES